MIVFFLDELRFVIKRLFLIGLRLCRAGYVEMMEVQ
jgi:hypothetical protein